MSDATLIQGARDLAAAKGTGGAGIKAIGKSIKEVGGKVSEAISKANLKKQTGAQTESGDKALQRLQKELRNNDFGTIELDGYTDVGREKIEGVLVDLNERLDAAVTAKYNAELNSAAYKAADEQIRAVNSEYLAFKKHSKTLRNFRAAEKDIVSLSATGDNITGGYSSVSMNTANIDKTTMLIGDDWTWTGKDFEWKYGEETLTLSNRAEYKPMEFEQLADFKQYLVETQQQAAKQLKDPTRKAKKNAVKLKLRQTLLENTYGPHILEGLVDEGQMFEFNKIFEDLNTDFANKKLSAAERVNSFKSVGEEVVERLADFIFPDENPPLPPEEEDLDAQALSFATETYKKYKNITSTNPGQFSSRNSLPIKLKGEDRYLQFKHSVTGQDSEGKPVERVLNKWIMVKLDGTPVSLDYVFDNLDDAIDLFPFDYKTVK